MSKLIDLTGQRFGKLTAVKYFKDSKWECLCDCGNKTFVRAYKLKSKHTRSCGCMERKTHGLRYHPMYKVWGGMIQRCQNSKRSRYFDYGRRGITVCKEWLTFENFYKDMYPTYKEGLSIDRIDNNKGYYKENCRWATPKEQMSNRRLPVNSHLITYKGRTQTMREWAKELNINYQTLANRINTYHWPIEKALQQQQ